LTMNVLEQTRELGILRAIGMRRRQVHKLILAQALLLAGISLVPGTLAGLILAYLMNRATYSLVGQVVPFQVDGVHVGGCLVAALGLAVLAASIPARRAARVPIVRAIQYE